MRKYSKRREYMRLYDVIKNKLRLLFSSIVYRMDFIVATTYAEYNMYLSGLIIQVNEAITRWIRVVRV